MSLGKWEKGGKKGRIDGPGGKALRKHSGSELHLPSGKSCSLCLVRGRGLAGVALVAASRTEVCLGEVERVEMPRESGILEPNRWRGKASAWRNGGVCVWLPRDLLMFIIHYLAFWGFCASFPPLCRRETSRRTCGNVGNKHELLGFSGKTCPFSGE